MATKETTEKSIGGTRDVVDKVEESLHNRREFILGAAIGGIGVGSALGVSGLTEGTQSERPERLASGNAATPLTQYHLPAVGSTDEGLIIDVSVSITEGPGDVYVDLNDVEVRHDIQLALREATVMAMRVADVSPDERSVFVAFDPPGDARLALRGKSWEAGLTVALLGALTGRQPSRRDLVTGVVGPDGELLPVEGIEAKANAARMYGAETLLVPPEQTVSLSGIEITAVEEFTEMARHVLE